MAIKRIPIGGIYKDPSGQISDDGMCAESLNVQIEQGEIAPMLAPENVTSDYGSTAATGLPGPAVFIHKGNGYNNLLYLDGTNVRAWPKGTLSNTPLSVMSLSYGESIKDIEVVGNTLIFITDYRIEYVLYKSGTYVDLGDKIPIPNIAFKTIDYKTNSYTPPWRDHLDDDDYINVGDANETFSAENLYIRTFDISTWQQYLNKTLIGQEYDESYNAAKEAIWGRTNIEIQNVKKQGYFCTPVFARYALRLYDGRYIYQSVPVLMGAGHRDFVEVLGIQADPALGSGGVLVKLRCAYKGYVQLYQAYGTDEFANWKDIIESIDIFLSTDIHMPQLNADIKGVTQDTAYLPLNNLVDISFNGGTDDEWDKETEKELLSKAVFFKVASFVIGDLSELKEGYDLMKEKNFASQDFLVTQERLPDGYQNFHTKRAGSAMTYNDRLMLNDLSYEIFHGEANLNGQMTDTEEVTKNHAYYVFKFFLYGPVNEELYVYSRGSYLDYHFQPYENEVWPSIITNENQSFLNYCIPYGWIAYPDSRCYKVEVLKHDYASNTDKYKTYDMSPHPSLNCSYAFFGLDKELVPSDAPSVAPEGFDWTEFNPPTENNTYSENNTLWAAEVNNPFVFLSSGKQTFTAEVVSMESATRALSEGQIGMFPLMVFTKDGIWAIKINDEGSFVSRFPMSRDIVLSKESIVPIEQAVVFVSRQGVMLLRESDITPLSNYMNGPSHKIPNEIATTLSSDEALAPIVLAHQDNTRFNEFIQGCKIAYDYVGRRLVFFRPDETYQYVYRFDSQSWHKMCVAGIGIVPQNRLNSYPDCLISVTVPRLGQGKYAIYNFSVEPSSSAEKSTLPGLIYVRDLSLDEADIYKTIHRFKIRGRFNHTHAKWAILGSNDGMTYYVIHSLHGPSWKWYRIILTSKLTEKERMSYLELEYTQKFINKLR